MRLSDLTGAAADALKSASAVLLDLITPTVRLGVTGLARSGKTVFITALVRNLVAGGRLPFFAAMAEGRITRAYLEPQPDDSVPRFAYEEHLADLAKDPPQWPESTRRISQLRVTIEYTPAAALRRALGPGRLHVDIVDYPGEWLIDLPLLELSFADWSRRAVEEARAPQRSAAAKPWLAFLSALDADAPANEQVALAGTALFTRYLLDARAPDPELTRAGARPLPAAGRPRRLAAAHVLPAACRRAGPTYPRGSLGAMLARRFESYKTHVVQPFFRDHFARLDRQIVLDRCALRRQRRRRRAAPTCSAAWRRSSKCFRPGANTWLSGILPRRIDRLLFAATKADHLHHTSHDRLEAILRLIADRAIARAAFAGAEVKAMALAALRSTREAEARQGRQRLPCIVGVPLPGERLGARLFDGRTEAAVFPGDLPEDPASLTAQAVPAAGSAPGMDASVHFLRFRPPRVTLETPSGDEPALPHIRLDRAIQFLLGDRLA